MRGRLLLMPALCLGMTTGAAWAQTEGVPPTDEPIAPAITAAPSSDIAMPELGERFHLYLRRTYSWQRMSLLALDTGIDSAIGDAAWGKGMDGYGHRFGYRFGRRVVGNSIEFAAGAWWREDLRYRRSTETDRKARIRHAAKSAFLAYHDDGTRGLAYARFAGYTGRTLISSTWCPHPLTARRAVTDIGFGLFDQVQNNLLSEFSPDLKQFGRQVWRNVRKR